MITTLMFDLGGVIVDIDRQGCIDALIALGMPAPVADQMIGSYIQNGPFRDLEAGQISPQEFTAAMRQHLPASVTDEQVAQAIQQFIKGLPVHRLQQLRTLAKHYRLVVLSNTNPIMMGGVIKRLFEQENREIGDYFSDLTLSYVAKANKPEARIYEWAIGHMCLTPADTLFLDDGPANLEAAKAFGFSTALVPPGGEFMQVLQGMGLA